MYKMDYIPFSMIMKMDYWRITIVESKIIPCIGDRKNIHFLKNAFGNVTGIHFVFEISG